MPRYIALILVGLIYAGSTATPVVAAKIGGSGSGLNFSCDVTDNICECKGVWEGADCQEMKKNCKKGKQSICWTSPIKKCTCNMKLQKPSSTRIPPVMGKFQKAPVANAPTKYKPKKTRPSSTGTIMNTVPMKLYKTVPMKQKRN